MKMANFKYILTILVLSFGLAIAQNPIAVVSLSKGDVSINKADGKKISKVKRGSKLYDGDKVITGKKGKIAVIFLDDKSLVRVRPNSSCTINAKKEGNSMVKNLYVEVGTIFSKITKQKTKFRVSTPTSVASVKGTEWWTVQEFKGKTMFFCDEGVIEVGNDAGTALVKFLETCIVNSSKSKPIVRKTKPGEKPTFDDEDFDVDSFEFEFINNDGNTKELKFKVQQKK